MNRCERKKKEIELKSIEMWPGRSFWKEVAKKIIRYWMVGQQSVSSFSQGGSTEEHRLFHCQEWYAVMRGIVEAWRKWEQKAKTSKKEWKWQRGVVEHPLWKPVDKRKFQNEDVGV